MSKLILILVVVSLISLLNTVEANQSCTKGNYCWMFHPHNCCKGCMPFGGLLLSWCL
nr:venom peptide [Acharia stimulea]